MLSRMLATVCDFPDPWTPHTRAESGAFLTHTLVNADTLLVLSDWLCWGTNAGLLAQYHGSCDYKIVPVIMAGRDALRRRRTRSIVYVQIRHIVPIVLYRLPTTRLGSYRELWELHVIGLSRYPCCPHCRLQVTTFHARSPHSNSRTICKENMRRTWSSGNVCTRLLWLIIRERVEVVWMVLVLDPNMLG